MKLKNIINASLCALLLVSTGSCKKSETLDVDMSRYVTDQHETSALDEWITANLTNPYNIQLVYRFDRNLMDVAKDVSPVKLDKVKPTSEAIINIFLKTYEKVAGPAFIKSYTPKQFVLYGSPSYNSNGSVTLGSADGGRRVVLYELNDLDFTSAAQVSRKLRTIHHEFTHILNQMIAIPPEFQAVTKSDYFADWTNSANTADTAKKLGYVSRYARSSYTEDFAEMVAYLLIEGQLWFDAYARSAGTTGEPRLKKKEAQVVDYFKQYFNINFRQLQFEIGKVLRDTYNDKTRGFTYALQNTLLVNPLAVDFNSGAHYLELGQSDKFKAVWENVKTAMAPAGLTPVSFNVVFLSPTVMQMQHTFRNASGSFIAWYDFNIAINSSGDITFTRFDNGSTATAYANGRIAAVQNGYAPLNNYLTTKVFKGDWIPANEIAAYYLKLGGFYVKNEADNYFYGKF
jgi:substrate import-associated zinc metallohydrolase lipoprotein